MHPIRAGAVAIVFLTGSLGSAVAQSTDRDQVRTISKTAERRLNRKSGPMDRARQFGYDDGLSDGANDRRTGYSFRLKRYDNYKKADRGYGPRFGSKEKYRQSYRQSYERGYRRGYYER